MLVDPTQWFTSAEPAPQPRNAVRTTSPNSRENPSLVQNSSKSEPKATVPSKATKEPELAKISSKKKKEIDNKVMEKPGPVKTMIEPSESGFSSDASKFSNNGASGGFR